jgi:hypothetical protein
VGLPAEDVHVILESARAREDLEAKVRLKLIAGESTLELFQLPPL